MKFKIGDIVTCYGYKNQKFIILEYETIVVEDTLTLDIEATRDYKINQIEHK
jgi:hypothetical protein